MRPERTRLSGKRAGREVAPAAGCWYRRVSPGNLERVWRARTGCRATRGSAWRQEHQAVPVSGVSGRLCSKGHFRLVAPPTRWSSGAPEQWWLPGWQGLPDVGGGHWVDGNAVWPGAGASVSAIPAGPCARDLSKAARSFLLPRRRAPGSPGGDTPLVAWLPALLRTGAEAGGAGCLLFPSSSSVPRRELPRLPSPLVLGSHWPSFRPVTFG